MNASNEGESFPGSVQSGTTVLVELTPDIHICGICKQHFNNLDAFVAHKQSGCQLTGTSAAAPSTVQFVSEETVPATQTQTATRTITSETQTITVSAPEFVFEHGYQTYLPTESNENQTATVISLPAKSRAKKPTAPPAQKRLNCCYPGCQFKTAYGMKDMERHLKIHTGDKPHKCDVCGKCFSRKDKLKTHMRCHTGVRPYKCKSCDYAAADSSSLNKHLRIHSDERPFKCQLCPYASRNSSQLTVHLRSHTASELDNDVPKPPCPSADSSDAQKAPVAALPSESKEPTATLGERTFNCCYPGCHFKTVHGMKDLDRHLRIHTGDKPHKCDFCDKCFSRKDNLAMHMRCHTSVKPHKCHLCDYAAVDSSSLKKHLRIHSDERPYKCQLCPYASRNSSQLTVHLRSHTGAPMNYLGGGGGSGNDELNGDGAGIKRPRREETHICEKCCAEFFSFSEFLDHKKNCTKTPPVLILKDSEGPMSSEDLSGTVLSSQPPSPGRREGHRDDGSGGGAPGDAREKPGAESVLYLKTEAALPPAPQDISYLPKGKVANTNVTLQALRGTKVAVNQRSADAPPAPLPSAGSLPWVLEQILCLQQQQLQQIQLTEQIRVQVNMWASHALHAGHAADSLKTLGGHVSQQVSAAVALLSQKAGSAGLPLDALKPAKLPHANVPSAGGSASPGLPPFALKPDATRVLPGVLSRLPGALLPQAPGSVLFQSPFSAVALDPSKKGKGKPPSVSPVEVKLKDEALCRHKCKYCSKVFGTDSSLQIHLRSHTGERPFVCSVCGHRFTTKGNLKVHFHRHPQVKANPQLLADFHDKTAVGGGLPFALAGPAPLEEAGLSLDSKPALAAGTPSVLGLVQNLPSGPHPKDVRGGPLPGDLQPGLSPESEDGSILPGVGPTHPSPRVGGFPGGGPPEPGSETLKLQRLVENIDKATADPNECLICHRVLSCQSSLKMHYRTHTGERPFPCKVCGRAFSTKGNLKTHLGVHRASASVRTQHSCPICQKKFTNAVLLQQHIRMHMGGQIPNAPLPESPCELAGPEPSAAGGDGSPGAPAHDGVMQAFDVDEACPQEAPSSSLRGPGPLAGVHAASPTPGLAAAASLDVPVKAGLAALVLQRQGSRENGSAESDGLTNDDASSVMGDPECASRSPDVLESTSFQAVSPAHSQAESVKSKSPDADGKGDGSESSRTEMEGRSSVPSTFIRAQPTYVKVEVPGGFVGPATMSPGMTPLLAAQPRRQAKQHGCTRCGKNFSSASALQIHERTHTGEKPFVCNICGRAFTTKGNLKVHYMTHGANNSSARRGRKLAIENTMALLGTDGKRVPEMFPKEIMAPSVNVDPVVWNQYATMLNGGLAMKTNEISVIQSGGIPTLPVSLGASSVVNNTAASKIDGSQSAAGAEVEKPGTADNVPKHQFPHLLEENKIAVS